MRLITEKIIIRDIEPEDEIAFINMASDGTLSEIFGDCSECYSWMGNWIKESIELYKVNNPCKEYLAYAIIDKSNNEVVGAVGCSAYEDINEIGITYFVGIKFRKQGFATEATNVFSKHFLINYSKVNRLIATVKPENISSCRCVEKSGYVFQERKLYKDINDDEPQWYNFYEFK